MWVTYRADALLISIVLIALCSAAFGYGAAYLVYVDKGQIIEKLGGKRIEAQ